MVFGPSIEYVAKANSQSVTRGRVRKNRAIEVISQVGCVEDPMISISMSALENRGTVAYLNGALGSSLVVDLDLRTPIVLLSRADVEKTINLDLPLSSLQFAHPDPVQTVCLELCGVCGDRRDLGIVGR